MVVIHKGIRGNEQRPREGERSGVRGKSRVETSLVKSASWLSLSF